MVDARAKMIDRTMPDIYDIAEVEVELIAVNIVHLRAVADVRDAECAGGAAHFEV